MKYLIRKAGQKPGTPPTEQEPVAGRVYACMQVDHCIAPEMAIERAGLLVLFDGAGWIDPDDEERDDVADWVADADYLQEQH
jgi:hypothetical protein